MSTHLQETQNYQDVDKAGQDIDDTRKIILAVFGGLLLLSISIVLTAYFCCKKLKKRPGNLLVPYLFGGLLLAIHWILHPFYSPDSEACEVVGAITVANEQLLRCYEASIFYALWKIYKVRGTNSHQEIKQRQKDFKRINWRFHLFSIGGMIYMTIISLLIESSGRDYYGLCKFQWVGKSEKGPIMFEGTIYFVFCIFNIFLCCDVWYSQRFPTREQIDDTSFIGLTGDDLLKARRKKAEVVYFQKMLKWYLFTTTGVGTMLSGLHFYAAYETSDKYRSPAVYIIHDTIIIAQPLLIMILKLDEPLVKHEVKMLGNKVKKVISKICSGPVKICRWCWDCIKPKSKKSELENNLIPNEQDENNQAAHANYGRNI